MAHRPETAAGIYDVHGDYHASTRLRGHATIISNGSGWPPLLSRTRTLVALPPHPSPTLVMPAPPSTTLKVTSRPLALSPRLQPTRRLTTRQTAPDRYVSVAQCQCV